MRDADPSRPPSGWERHADEQFEGWLRLTWVQRLAWLEAAKAFVAEVGEARAPASGPSQGGPDAAARSAGPPLAPRST